MATPRNKYYTKIYETLVYYNNHNDAPFSNAKIKQATHKVISEEEAGANKITLDAHNVTVNTFS